MNVNKKLLVGTLVKGGCSTSNPQNRVFNVVQQRILKPRSHVPKIGDEMG